MTIRRVVVAGVYCVCVASGGLVGGSGAPVGASPFASAQAPASRSDAIRTPAADALPVRSTRLERRDAAAGLRPVVAAIAKSDDAPAWLAWTVPAVTRTPHGSASRERDWQRDSAGCVLDDEGRFQNGSSTNDDTTELVVLARLTGGVIDRVTFADARCTVQAGTRTVYWIDVCVQPTVWQPCRASSGVTVGIRSSATAPGAGRSGREAVRSRSSR